MSRRSEYAETTRLAIVAAARHRFAKQGYVSTTIEQIAQHARVVPKTVCAVAGGKRGLLRTVIQPWAEAAEVNESLSRMRAMQSGMAVLTLVSTTVGHLCEELRDVIYVLTEAARQDEAAASVLESTTTQIRRNLEQVTEHLHTIQELRPDLTPEAATDILNFYFRPQSYLYLVDELRWAARRAELWLAGQAAASLLAPHTS